MIRGLSTNRLVLSVDGVRLNNAIYRGGNIHNVISVSPMNIENTEIIMGLHQYYMEVMQSEE